MNRPDTAAPLARLDRLADALDNRFRLFGIRFGWDSILGLIPGVGDVASGLPGIYIINEAARMGARRSVLARMGVNTAVDIVVGGVPILGDLFDVAFKANRRNIALLKRDMARAAQDRPYIRQHKEGATFMADRHRSQDGTRDTDLVPGGTKAPRGQGRDGGRLARDIGSRDEEKRATERPAGSTRLRKSDKKPEN